MKGDTHRGMFLFATSFSWWLVNLGIALEPASAGLLRQSASPAEAGSKNEIVGR